MSITYAYLETTNYCNLNCSFCNRHEVIGKLSHMSLVKWDIVLEKLKHHPIAEAKLMGMGEPLLHPQFDEVCKRFKQTFPKCKVIVATNCQYKLGDKFKRSLEYIDELYFSIDGFEESYERDRSPAKWTTLIKFLEDFKDIDRQGCEVVVNYTVNPDNVFEIPHVERLIEKYDLGELRLNIVQSWDEDSTISAEDSLGYIPEQIAFLKTYLPAIKGKSVWDFEDCFWVHNGMYMTVSGDVKICCMNTGATPVGNIFVDSIDEIRETDAFMKIKHGCMTNEPTDHCKNCSYKELVPILTELGVNN
jgi:MoaA/NifB/PqqE/SkfB family radical SAM enzyme